MEIMRVDKEKTFELLRTYSLTLERSMNEDEYRKIN